MTENEISYKIIGVAIELHKVVGPGLLESVYENALCFDLKELGFDVKQQVPCPFIYKSLKMETGFRIDMLVENKVIVAEPAESASEIADDVFPRDILTQNDGKVLRRAVLPGIAHEDIPHPDLGRGVIRDFDSDERRLGNGCFDTDRVLGKREREVVGE